ncbi:elongation of very long chain fatty acids protein-like [Daktulosphaira vitifoliae]|uniref:elongation of very long chain fatty acids protein-like n=1 Tax=Daktulosphaira vitifoliae TaxID=58002 RepID=UPI0021AAF8D2|nr:elongation of very long chain fatty acids protein-like [Daktulosphaira vitifoliae]
MSWFKSIDELLYSDYRTRDWPMMSTTAYPTLISLVYVFFIKVIGPKYMTNKKPYKLRKILMVYNIGQILACTYLSISFLKTNPKFGCDPLDLSNDPMSIHIASLVWWTKLLKLTEYIETVFFVLRKKQNQISALHIYHHVSTYMIIWMSTRINPGGVVRIPVILNCFVHMMMYFYYLLSSLGPKIQKKIEFYKKYITIIQMVQFCIIIVNSLFFFAPDCNVPNIYGYVFIPNVFLVFYMFYDFYNNAYSEKGAHDIKNRKQK